MAEGLIYVYQRFQGGPRRARSKDASYVTQHPPAAAKNKFMEKHCGVFCSMAQVWEFVAEQAIEMILERHHGGCLYRLNDIEDIMKLVR
jgi:hypothetical protein